MSPQCHRLQPPRPPPAVQPRGGQARRAGGCSVTAGRVTGDSAPPPHGPAVRGLLRTPRQGRRRNQPPDRGILGPATPQCHPGRDALASSGPRFAPGFGMVPLLVLCGGAVLCPVLCPVSPGAGRAAGRQAKDKPPVSI